MPGMDGIEAARQLNSLVEPPAVIFTTAYDEYAINAFDAQAVGYLLKPIRKEKLAASLAQAGPAHSGRSCSGLPPANAPAEAVAPETHAHRRPASRRAATDPDRRHSVFLRRAEVHHGASSEGRGPDRGLAPLAGRGVRPEPRADSPERAGERSIPRKHRAECRRAVLREAARVSGAAAGEPANGGRAARAVQDLGAPHVSA